jgi:hypothetical protein
VLGFQNNRRIQPRAPVRLPARLSMDGKEIETSVLLISEGGCFVALTPPPPKHARLKVQFDIPAKGPHTAEVEVRYQADLGDYRGRRDVSGVGCRFVAVSSTTKQAIRELIAQVKKSYAQIQFALGVSGAPNPQLKQLLEKAQLTGVREGRELREAVQWGLKQMGA